MEGKQKRPNVSIELKHPGIWRSRSLRVWERWKVIAHAIGNFQARVLLSLLYVVVVPPFGLLVRTMMDPLQLRRPPRESFWLATPAREHSLTDTRRQF